ncbi:MAG: hypothetical protein GX257_00420 [Clostridiales bacterium]|jgi:putative tributyrin esterase|nr:hypothetical protein [Clostridiales bacterium]
MAVMRLNMLSKTLGMHTNVTVILPSFDQGFDIGRTIEDIYGSTPKFKTLWLLHGGSGDDADYLNWTNVARYAVETNCAVICPNAYNSAYSDYPRGAKYYSFVVDELREFCINNLPISDKREDNFVGGLSMGSGGAMKIAMDRCDEYSVALIMSGGIPPRGGSRGHAEFRKNIIAAGWPMPKQPRDVTRPNIYEIAEKNIAEGRNVPKFYFACGDKDNIAYESYLYGTMYLRELGYDVTGYEVPGYKHEWDFWELTLRKVFYEWLPLDRKTVAMR